jgi:hypothetical protein
MLFDAVPWAIIRFMRVLDCNRKKSKMTFALYTSPLI